jgi:serine carboxypeptidase-like clade II
MRCSGDLDSVVPITSTRQSINKLALPVADDWRPWSSDNEQVRTYACKNSAV